MRDSVTTSFETGAALLEDALRGVPLQLSSPEGYCRIESGGEVIHLEYALKGTNRKTCSIPAGKLQEAIRWARDSGLE